MRLTLEMDGGDETNVAESFRTRYNLAAIEAA